jgi:hypothetical protein
VLKRGIEVKQKSEYEVTIMTLVQGRLSELCSLEWGISVWLSEPAKQWRQGASGIYEAT